MYKLCFYVPESHLEPVKKAVFAVGGGRIGAYDSCCWQALDCRAHPELLSTRGEDARAVALFLYIERCGVYQRNRTSGKSPGVQPLVEEGG